MTLNRSRSTKTLPSIVLGLALVAGATTARAQGAPPTTPPAEAPADDAGGAPLPPPEAPPVDTVEVPAVVEEAPPPAPPPPPEKLKVAKEGTFQPAVLLQGWFVVDDNGTATTDAFKLRRAEVHLKGQIVPNKIAYEVHADFAKVLEPKTTKIPTTPPTAPLDIFQSKISPLQDLYLTYITKNAEFSLGQFKIPVSWEGYNSSGKVLFPERAPVSGLFGDKRDLGLRITKTFSKFMYSAGVFNGTGQNQPENNKGKDVGLRLEYYPIKGLTIAGTTYDSVFDRKQPGAKDRWELDARYEKDKVLVQAEAIVSRDYDANKNRLDGGGFYVAAAYKVTAKLQPDVRLGAVDTDTSKDGTPDDTRFVHLDLGANYYLADQNAKLQASYTRTQYDKDGKKADNLVILAAQIYY